MNNNKIYVYEGAKPHVHDSNLVYKNTVPLSREGLEKHFKIVSDPTKADYFYMGQISNDSFRTYNENTFEYYKDFPQKHICDIEGEGGLPIPQWLHKSIITTMGPLKSYSNINSLFARPTFSYLLLDIIKNRNEAFRFPKEHGCGFKGFINCKTRAMLLYVLHHATEYKKEISVNKKWSGPSEIGSKIQQDYIDMILRNPISLCPRGSGIDSVRLLETCYYTRVPVLISDLDYYLVGEDRHNTDFCFRICDSNMTPDSLKEELVRINETSLSELEDRAHLARKYFDKVIREYFKDPTLYFLKWLETNED